MLRNIGAPEIIIIAVLLILILGWKRLPDAARSLGRSMRIFKSEVDGDEDRRQERGQQRHRQGRGRPRPGRPGAPHPARHQGTSPIREDNSPRTDNSSGAS